MRRLAAAAGLLLAVLAAAGCPGGGGSGGGAKEPDDPKVGGGGGGGGGAGGNDDAAMTAELLGQVGDALGCPKSSATDRAFCIAVDGWASGTAAPLPAERTSMVGLTVSLAEADPVEKSLEQTVRLAALGVRPFQERHLVRVVSWDAAEPGAAEGAAYVRAALGGDEPGKLPGEIAGALPEVSAEGYVVKTEGKGHHWKSGATRAELRRVKAGGVEAWVVVEIPLEGDRGIFLSVFTDATK